MNQPIPDQLRQWHAQFSAGDVLFSRIMADIDAVIACYVDPLTPDNVIELAQLYVLKIALYEAARKLNVRNLALLTQLGYASQALALAELWRDDTPEYFRRLVAIYIDLPTENITLLHKIYALFDQGNMPNTAFEDLVFILLERGKFEVVWQWMRLGVVQSYQHSLSRMIEACVDEGRFELACIYWQSHTQWEYISNQFVITLSKMAAALQYKGWHNALQMCFGWFEAPNRPLPGGGELVPYSWIIALQYVAFGDYQRSQAIFETDMLPETNSDDFDWGEVYRELGVIFDHLPHYADPAHLASLYHLLPPHYQTSVFGAAIAERLLALGAQDAALPMFQQVRIPGLWRCVLPHLQTLGDTDTLAEVLTTLEDQFESAASDAKKDQAVITLVQVLLALGRHDATEPYLLDSLHRAAQNLTSMSGLLTSLADAGAWQMFISLVNRWVIYCFEQQRLNDVFDTLRMAIPTIADHSRQQALDWSGQLLTESILTMPHSFRSDSLFQDYIVRKMISIGNIAGFEQLLARGWVPTYLLYLQVATLLANSQPVLALRFFRSARATHITGILTAIYTELQRVNLGAIYSTPKQLQERRLTRHWQRNASNITDFIAAFKDTIPLMHAIAPDLPRRALEACVMLLDEFMSVEQTA